MIKCALCCNRIRPPSRPWTPVEGGVSFYRTDSDMDVYAAFLKKRAKTTPFVHEACMVTAEPDELPPAYITALDLNLKLRQQQRNHQQ